MIPLIFAVMVCTHSISVYSLPIQETDPANYQRDLNAVSYIQNFKNIMSDYVTSQYTNLTIDETEQVKNALEEFLINFAKDLREAVDNKNTVVVEQIQDGVPEETFEEIKKKIQAEFPDVKEETAQEIVYRLRKNLFVTRQKLDVIIRNSERAQFEVALD